jgi:hypothetical protein
VRDPEAGQVGPSRVRPAAFDSGARMGRAPHLVGIAIDYATGATHRLRTESA